MKLLHMSTTFDSAKAGIPNLAAGRTPWLIGSEMNEPKPDQVEPELHHKRSTAT